MTVIVSVQLQPAPTTPLNLQFGILYAARVVTPPFVGFRAFELAPDIFQIDGIDAAGRPQEVFRGGLADTWTRLAQHLRMDVPPGSPYDDERR